MKNLSFIGFNQYAVTPDAKVFSIRAGKYMKHAVEKSGYCRINLGKDGKKFRWALHRLVALAYIPNPENKPTVNHIDGNKENNHVSNLEWSTHSEQQYHAFAAGLRKNSEFNDYRQLDDDTVHQICRYLTEGFRPIEVARLLGLPRHTIKNVRSGTQYKDVIKCYDFDKISKKHGRLSITKVSRICDLLSSGVSSEIISKSLNIPVQTVDSIKEKKLYKTLSQEFNFK